MAKLSKVLKVVCWLSLPYRGLLSGVVVSGASRFVALCCRPCRIGIADRDKLMVSYILPNFS